MSPFQIPAQAEIPSSGGGYLGEGTHGVTVDEVDTSTSSNGNPQIVVTFKDDTGKTIRDWVTVTDRAMWRVQLLWEACGLPWPEGGGEIDENDLLGKRLLIVVAPDTWNGVTRDKVKDYQALVGSDLGFTPVPGPQPQSAIDDTIPF